MVDLQICCRIQFPCGIVPLNLRSRSHLLSLSFSLSPLPVDLKVGQGESSPGSMRMRGSFVSQCYGYSMPLRRIWLAAINMTLIIKAIAKAHIKLFRTQVCRFCFWECTKKKERKKGGGRVKKLKINSFCFNNRCYYYYYFWSSFYLAYKRGIK